MRFVYGLAWWAFFNGLVAAGLLVWCAAEDWLRTLRCRRAATRIVRQIEREEA